LAVLLLTYFTGFEVLDRHTSKFSLVMLELFLMEYTAGRGLGIACNTLRMLVIYNSAKLGFQWTLHPIWRKVRKSKSSGIKLKFDVQLFLKDFN
jgi:hypothetical protein